MTLGTKSQQDRKIARMGEMIDWRLLECHLGHYFASTSAPPMRVLIGLLYLRAINDVSYEEACEQWIRSAVWQEFCGNACLSYYDSIKPMNLSIWERVIGEEGTHWMCKALPVDEVMSVH